MRTSKSRSPLTTLAHRARRARGGARAVRRRPARRATQDQPVIGARSKPVLTVDGLRFKDSNGNGQLDRYEDWRLDADARAADLVSKMTLDEKAGMMLIDTLNPGFGGVVAPPAEDYVRNQKMTRFIFRSVVDGQPGGIGRPRAGAAAGRRAARGRPRRPEAARRAAWRRPGDARAGRDVDERDPGTRRVDAPRHPGALQVERAEPLRAQRPVRHQHRGRVVLRVAEGSRPRRHARPRAHRGLRPDDGPGVAGDRPARHVRLHGRPHHRAALVPRARVLHRRRGPRRRRS